ncbi:MAG: ABC transporter permease [Candidatus Brockarchaeota archaeon]|nr:ABC transporter permease [Candidatus Brockarchaeota archaeon]
MTVTWDLSNVRISDQLKRAFAICKKNIRVYYIKGPVIVFGILIPLFLFGAFLIGREIPPKFLVSSLMSMSVFFTATAVAPAIMPWEGQAKTLERLVSSPVSIATIVLGDIFASFLFGVLLSLVPFALGLAIGVTVIDPATLLTGVLLASFCFSSLAAALSTWPTNIPSNVMMLMTFVKFPLLFISGIFVPIEKMPDWSRPVASLSPLTYFVDLARYSIEGINHYPISLSMVALTAFSLLFFTLAVKLHEKNMPKRL